MERQKKLLSLVLALVMLFTTAVVAVVAEEPTVISTETVAISTVNTADPESTMFKLEETAQLVTYSDGTQALMLVYKGSSFLNMYSEEITEDEYQAGTYDETKLYKAGWVNKETWKIAGTADEADTNPRYIFEIPYTKSTETTDSMNFYVRSSREKWTEYTINIAYLESSQDVKIIDDSAMVTTEEAGAINTYADGTKTLEFYILTKDSTSSFRNIYNATADEVNAQSKYKTAGMYTSIPTGKKQGSYIEYKYELPLPEEEKPLDGAYYSSKKSEWDSWMIDYSTENQTVTAVTKYDNFTIEQEVIVDEYKSGALIGDIAYPDSSFVKAYLGSAAEASTAKESKLIGVDENGKFTIQLAALDTETKVAVCNGTEWIDTTLMYTTDADDTTGDDTTGDDTTSDDTTSDDTTSGTGSSESATTPNIIPTDGNYTITVSEDEKMFGVIACDLEVTDGVITATVTLSGVGYNYMYAGTVDEALAAGTSKHIEPTPVVVDGEERYAFEFEISSLDKPIIVATHATKSGEWKNRTLVFDSSTLRLVAEGSTNTNTSAGTGSSTTTEENKNLSASDIENMLNKADKTEKTSDGTYKPSFGFTGGSGRTSISCNKVVVKDGKATATIVFDSETFTWVQVDGVKYYNQNKGGNSTFVIPVIINDKTPIVAQTVGMSQPHEIEYMLYCFIDGTKAPASTPPIETTTDENTENGKSEDVKDDGNSWGSFDEESVDNEVETGTAENASGISGSLIFIIVAVAFAVGAVAFLVSKKKRG